MPVLEKRNPGFSSVKQLLRRMSLASGRSGRVSADDSDVPHWQRGLVWSEDQMGLLVLSVIREFPIGMMILWQKSSGVKVPIDGRQRLNALWKFSRGEIALPDLPSVPEQLRKRKYRLLDGDEDQGFAELELEDKETFEDYELDIVQYDTIPEPLAMEIFVMLQGGTSLTKTEIRAALGGKLCEFVGQLTGAKSSDRHEFFRELSRFKLDRRKSHRNVCDVLLHEFLYPDQDKHWTSLDRMYREKANVFAARQQSDFKQELLRFSRAASRREEDGVRHMLPQLRDPFLILDVYRAWRELHKTYDLPSGYDFAGAIAEFETLRAAHREEVPWLVFTNELSNAGYAKNRLTSRHKILMTFLLQHCPDAQPKARDNRRAFTLAQKIAIWERAEHRCEWVEESSGTRCEEAFADPRSADADHIVKHSENGPTSLANARLLCQAHNRARR